MGTLGQQVAGDDGVRQGIADELVVRRYGAEGAGGVPIHRCRHVGPMQHDPVAAHEPVRLVELHDGSPRIIGRQGEEEITGRELARLLGTTAAQVLCNIAGRVRRVYLDGE